MFNQGFEELLMNRVQYVEEVRSVTISTLRKLVWKVHHKRSIIIHVLHHMSHAQFVVMGYMNSLDFLEFKQFLPPAQDQFQKVFVDPINLGHV